MIWSWSTPTIHIFCVLTALLVRCINCPTQPRSNPHHLAMSFLPVYSWHMIWRQAFSNVLPLCECELCIAICYLQLSIFLPIAILSFDSSHMTSFTRELLSIWSWFTINKKTLVIFLQEIIPVPVRTAESLLCLLLLPVICRLPFEFLSFCK